MDLVHNHPDQQGPAPHQHFPTMMVMVVNPEDPSAPPMRAFLHPAMYEMVALFQSNGEVLCSATGPMEATLQAQALRHLADHVHQAGIANGEKDVDFSNPMWLIDKGDEALKYLRDQLDSGQFDGAAEEAELRTRLEMMEKVSAKLHAFDDLDDKDGEEARKLLEDIVDEFYNSETGKSVFQSWMGMSEDEREAAIRSAANGMRWDERAHARTTSGRRHFGRPVEDVGTGQYL